MRAVEDTDLHGATTLRALATAQSLGHCFVQLLEFGGVLSLDDDQDPERNQQLGDEADKERRAPPIAMAPMTIAKENTSTRPGSQLSRSSPRTDLRPYRDLNHWGEGGKRRRAAQQTASTRTTQS